MNNSKKLKLQLSDSPIFFDVEEAAQFLRVKPSTLYAWVHEKRIPKRKHGRRLVFAREELIAWSDKNNVSDLDELTSSENSIETKPISHVLDKRRSLKTRHNRHDLASEEGSEDDQSKKNKE